MRTLFVTIVLLLPLLGCSPSEEQQPFPEKEAPSFTGTDQQGNAFSTSQLKGKVWLASFFFTSCQTVCPTLNAEQQKLVRTYGDKIKFVSISTDPDNDTGAVLLNYARSFGASPGVWWMIHMPSDQVRALATTGFNLMDPKEPEMHSTRFIAIGADGMIKGYFSGTDSLGITKLTTWINSQL